MTTMALPQVQVSAGFRPRELFGRRATQLLVALTMALGLILGLSITSGAGTASAATGDSAPVNFGLGRAYWGDNGLEIRLTRDGTELAYMASQVTGGVGVKSTELGAAALAKFGPIMQQIIRSGGIDTARTGVQIVGGVGIGAADWGAEKIIIPDGMCLGITWAPQVMAPSSYMSVPANPHNTTTWLEPCS